VNYQILRCFKTKMDIKTMDENGSEDHQLNTDQMAEECKTMTRPFISLLNNIWMSRIVFFITDMKQYSR